MHAISIMMIPELLFFALFTVDKLGSKHSSSFIGLTKTKRTDRRDHSELQHPKQTESAFKELIMIVWDEHSLRLSNLNECRYNKDKNIT